MTHERRSLPTFTAILDGRREDIYIHARSTFTDNVELGRHVVDELFAENSGTSAMRHTTIRRKVNVALALGGRHSLITEEEAAIHFGSQ